ncbi:MAG: DNA polymerase III subunit delta [Oscillospiraceae bacterium]|nr:DNA polymerase III subunit delta [Oscillospiraceae bacterium]
MAEYSLDRLKTDLKSRQPGSFYIFHGPEAYLRDHYLESLRSLLVEDFAEAFNYHRFSPETISLQAVADSVNAIPMMSPTSMVRIDDVNFFAIGEDAADYAAIFSNLPSYCTVVLVYDTVEYKPDRRKKTIAEALDLAREVCFQQPSERELISWIARHFKKLGKQITVDDAVFLIRRTGGDMTTLSAEIEKLGAYETEPAVSRRSIELLVEPVLEAAVFDLSDAVAAGRYETALQILHILLRRQEEPVVILATIGSQLRRIVEANRLRAAGKGKNDLMKLCSVSSYPAQKAMEFSRRLPAEFPEKALELCLEADRRMKTSFDDPKRVLELLVLQLAEEAAHA